MIWKYAHTGDFFEAGDTAGVKLALAELAGGKASSTTDGGGMTDASETGTGSGSSCVDEEESMPTLYGE